MHIFTYLYNYPAFIKSYSSFLFHHPDSAASCCARLANRQRLLWVFANIFLVCSQGTCVGWWQTSSGARNISQVFANDR